ncbi:MAG: glutamate mutase L [Clostridia bacterium]|nr:glutamate mutase L [Clostridia bacterium]
MNAILLIDFGSTYTKVTAVDTESEEILGTASSYTTIETDINDGLNNALKLLFEKTGSIEFAERYACSSAAGGLRMVTSGFVKNLTAEASRLASLGAGAKVVGVYSYELTEDDIVEIDASRPDIILLTGGTDGGNTECILKNAKMISTLKTDCPVVVAGNRAAAKECASILSQNGREVHVEKNVMPRFSELCIEPAQNAIREIFLKRIVKAKGLSEASELISGIIMPTPSAVQQAMVLLADGTENEQGIGELVAVDLGGATTDVYSVAEGFPQNSSTVLKGLPEPRVKRTVEGDIGMRYSIHGIADAATIKAVSQLAQCSEERCIEMIDYLSEHTDEVPTTEEFKNLDRALASLAIEMAVKRHAGTVEQVYTPMGLAFAQEGKDLSAVHNLVATGGALIHSDCAKEIAAFAQAKANDPASLRPKEAKVLVDEKYILAAMGLLSEHYPEVALRIMKKELV